MRPTRMCAEADEQTLSRTCIAAADSRTPYLVVMSGCDIGKSHGLRGDRCTLGRSPEADVFLRDPSVSRLHAAILRDSANRFSVVDFNSTNGTYLNGRRIKTASITSGDRLQFGHGTIAKFELQDELEQQFYSRIYDLGTRDPLTGLFNRRFFETNLAMELETSRRYRRQLSVLMVDIDRFKAVNDSLGHLAGDKLLIDLTECLTRRLRSADLVARFGGEEFVVVLRETSLADAEKVAADLRDLVERTRFSYLGIHVPVTVSIGVSGLDCAAATCTGVDLVAQADKALYRAKSNGRNRVEVARLAATARTTDDAAKRRSERAA